MMRFHSMVLVLGSVAAISACGGSTNNNDAATDTGGTSPTISITSPMDMAMVTQDAMHHVSIAFTVANFTLMAPGSCMGAMHCGHIHLTIDGASCNASGAPYNAAGAASPMNADVSLCPMGMQTGMHTINLELRNDDHSALATPVSATVHVTVM